MKNFIAKMMSTFFFVGDMPVAPGSCGTLVGMLVCLALMFDPIMYVIVFVIITLIGTWAADVTEKIMGKKDPGCVVIDEVSGVMVTFFLVPMTVPIMIVGFFVFRAFDMFKIYPANRLEAMGGGFGIMADDVMAGIYANVTLQLALQLANFI